MLRTCPLRSLLYDWRIAGTRLNEEIVFVIGHPRTGTTHMHYLFGCDPNLVYPSTFNVGRSRSAAEDGLLCLAEAAAWFCFFFLALRLQNRGGARFLHPVD